MVARIATAPVGIGPLEAAAALDPAVGWFRDRHGEAVQHQRIIDSSPALEERELMESATLAVAIDTAQRQRGVEEVTASLAAGVVVTVFRVALGRWVEQRGEPPLEDVVRDPAETFRRRRL